MQAFFARWKATFSRVATIPMVFLGVGLYRAWLAIFFRYDAFPLIVANDYAIFEASIGLVCLVLAFAARRVVTLWNSSLARGLTIASMTLGSALLVLDCFYLRTNVLKYIGLVLAGGGLGSLILIWAEFYGSLNPMRVALYHAAGIALGEVIKWLFIGMSAPYLAFFAVVLPFFCVGWARRCIKYLPEADLPARNISADERIFPWKPILLMTVCTFATGFGTFAIQPLQVGNTLGSLFVSLLVFIGVLSASKWFNFDTIYQLAFPLLTIGFLLIAPNLGFSRELVALFYDAGYTMLSMFIMIILSNITYRFGISAIWISGIERGLRYGIETAGWLLYTYLATDKTTGAYSTVHTAIAVVMAIAFIIIFFTERGLSAKWGINLQPAASDEELSAAHLAMRVSDLSKKHALSPREEEVIQLLARGDSLEQIERNLYVAHGTMKAHISHIYRKLDIHSRDELDQMLQNLKQQG